MQPGIFGKTFATTGALATLRAVAEAGYGAAQFNFASLGLPSMPDSIADTDAASVGAAARQTGVSIAAVSGTYNMIHPDRRVRAAGLRQLAELCRACPAMGTGMVTLCTGTRDANDQWRWHPDNASAQAWRELVREMTAAAAIAERFGVKLGIEPELANVVSSAAHARRLLDEIGSPALRIVLDPANLFETADASARRNLVDEAVALLAGDIAMAHAKDRSANGTFVAAGRGVIDFRHFIATLKAAGFDGPLVTHGLAAHEAAGVAAFLRATLEAEDAL